MEGRITNLAASEDVAPSAAWLVAQALLGKAVPTVGSAQSKARKDRELLEWLATISPRHEQKLRHVLIEETQAANGQRCSTRWAEDACLQEAGWDPSKHPRRGESA